MKFNMTPKKRAMLAVFMLLIALVVIIWQADFALAPSLQNWNIPIWLPVVLSAIIGAASMHIMHMHNSVDVEMVSIDAPSQKNQNTSLSLETSGEERLI